MPDDLDATALVPWALSASAWLAGLGVLVLGLARARKLAVAAAALVHLTAPPAILLLVYASLVHHLARFGAEHVAGSLLVQLGWAALAGTILLALVEGLLVAATARRER